MEEDIAMEDLLERYKLGIKETVWFVCCVVVPLTVWFMVIKSELVQANAKIVIMEENEQKLAQEINILKTRMNDKLEAIHKDVGEIKGELKRIRR